MFQRRSFGAQWDIAPPLWKLRAVSTGVEADDKPAPDGVCCDWLLWDQLGSNDVHGGVATSQ